MVEVVITLECVEFANITDVILLAAALDTDTVEPDEPEINVVFDTSVGSTPFEITVEALVLVKSI